jgi:long-chain acyl-CoA synthetase
MVSVAEKPWLKHYKLGPYKLPQTKAPYPRIAIQGLLDAAAAEFPGKAACSYLGREMSYADLKQEADRFATALVSLGVKQGDKVATILPTCPQFIIGDFGILKAGAVHVPCSVLHKAADLIYEIGDSGAETVICTDMSLETVNSIRGKTHIKNVIVTSVMDYSSQRPGTAEQRPGILQFRDLIAGHEADPPEIDIDPMKDLAVLPFTGGATGLPKGVMITHYNRAVAMTHIAWYMGPLKVGVRGKTSMMLPVAFFHQYGHMMMHFAVYWGLKMYLVPDPRDVDMLFEMLTRHRPFVCSCVPTQYSRLTARGLGRTNTMFMSGAAALAVEVAQRFKKQTGMPITEGYGLSETSGGTHINLSAFSKLTGFMAAEKLGSIGVPFPDTEVKIVDLDSGEEAAPGKEGELWVRGPQVMLGYWPEVGKGLVDGWLPTGDVVTMDEDGYFYVTDRVKDMANISGLKVYTRLVDDVLYEHPAVADAVAIGIPDLERPGSDRIKAFIRLNPEYEGKVTAEEIIDHCKAKLPAYAVPKFVEFRSELPLTVTDKLFKRQLREEEVAKMKTRGELK